MLLPKLSYFIEMLVYFLTLTTEVLPTAGAPKTTTLIKGRLTSSSNLRCCPTVFAELLIEGLRLVSLFVGRLIKSVDMDIPRLLISDTDSPRFLGSDWIGIAGVCSPILGPPIFVSWAPPVTSMPSNFADALFPRRLLPDVVVERHFLGLPMTILKWNFFLKNIGERSEQILFEFSEPLLQINAQY